ncbi:MAG: TIGR00266 family protein [Caldilineaceae bacterium]|nr:TIGR00266 family protein [Caldilineaceae bacterium]
MEYGIESQPTYSVLEVTLHPSESIVAESGAMVWMSDSIQLSTSARGGLFRSLRRSALGSESFFQNVFEARGTSGVVGFAPGQPGDIVAIDLSHGDILLEDGAFLASEQGVGIDSNFQGFQGLFNEGLFILRASGSGLLFFSGYGDIEEIEVNGSYIVDNGHAVAWEPTLRYGITRGRSIRSFLFSDQLLLRFSGRGRLWVQSRSPQVLANWVHPYRSVVREDDEKDREH